MAEVKRVALRVVEPTDPTREGLPFDGVPDISIEPTLVATARRRYGAGGAILAAGVLGLDEALGLRKIKEEVPIVVDSDGIDVPVDDETSVYAPPQPRSKPHLKTRRR